MSEVEKLALPQPQRSDVAQYFIIRRNAYLTSLMKKDFKNCDDINGNRVIKVLPLVSQWYLVAEKHVTFFWLQVCFNQMIWFQFDNIKSIHIDEMANTYQHTIKIGGRIATHDDDDCVYNSNIRWNIKRCRSHAWLYLQSHSPKHSIEIWFLLPFHRVHTY